MIMRDGFDVFFGLIIMLCVVFTICVLQSGLNYSCIATVQNTFVREEYSREDRGDRLVSIQRYFVEVGQKEWGYPLKVEVDKNLYKDIRKGGKVAVVYNYALFWVGNMQIDPSPKGGLHEE